MQNYDVAIIGGGAAGLACAVSLIKEDKNLSVIIIEKGERAGRKIAASGNGQGNASNAEMSVGHYHGSGAYLAGKLCCEGGVQSAVALRFFIRQRQIGAHISRR